uniref:SAG family member n=1 Tax=Steinernema glaseri TaxID=37863 RepID=A0A1I7YZ26_9BILA
MNAYGLPTTAANAKEIVIHPLQKGENGKISCKSEETITIDTGTIGGAAPTAGNKAVLTFIATLVSADCSNENSFCKKLDAFVVKYDSPKPSYFETITFQFEDGNTKTFKFGMADMCCKAAQQKLWFGQGADGNCATHTSANNAIAGAANTAEAGYYLVFKENTNDEATIRLLNQMEFTALAEGSSISSYTQQCTKTACA